LIVVDASVLANVIGDDGSDGQRTRGEIRGVGPVASYVALAELLGCELLTGDRRLAGAPGPSRTIRLLQ
jgi:hypothetical protein